MFMAGGNERVKSFASQLAFDAGFGSGIDFGNSDKVEFFGKFALSWINHIIMQEQGSNIALKIFRR
jgi:hypothetical protein